MTKVVSAVPSGQMWKEFHIINVSLDNGITGTALAKSAAPWYTPGTEVEFTQNPNGGLKISKVGGFDSPASGGGDRSEAISRAVAFKAAVELAAHGKITLEAIQEWTTKLLPIVTGKEAGQSYDAHFPAPAVATATPQAVGNSIPQVPQQAQLNNPF
jgi:hypothetical protein